MAMRLRFACLAVLWMLAACGTDPVRSSATYTVKAGDTLFSIARRHGMEYQELAKLNEIGKDFRIYPGQVLKVRGGTRAAAASPRPTDKPAATVDIPPPTTLKFNWPTVAAGVTSSTRPNGGRGLLIKGIAGQDIRAVEAGRVMYRGTGLLGYGQLLIIRHDERFLSAYGHLEAIEVNEGQQVSAGQKIASMGNGPDGQPVLYFEIRVDGTPVAPLLLLQQQR